MKPIYLIAVLTLLVLSCSHKQKPDKKDTTLVSRQHPYVPIEPKEDTATIVLDTTKKLLSYSIDHFFSDTAKKDKFNISLFGKSIIDGVVVFEIADYAHNQLFKETFPASDLLGDMVNDLNTKQQKDTIQIRMAEFLDTSNFYSPAIDSKEIINDDFDSPDKSAIADWNDIKADHTAVSFTYSHGYESTYGIAFSKKRKKVVDIFYSD